MLLILFMILATALALIWLLLLSQVTNEDWKTAAYCKLFDLRAAIVRLQEKDQAKEQKLLEYHGIEKKVMSVLLGGDSQKQITKLKKQGSSIQEGNISGINLLEMPGYVIQRRFDSIGKGATHKKLMAQSSELYGKKYAPYKTKQLLARVLSYPVIGLAASFAVGTVASVSDKTKGIVVLLVCVLLVVFLTYAVYDDMNDKVKKRRMAIERQFPNVVSKLALLVTSGMIMDRAWRETAESQTSVLYQEMRKTAEELTNLVDPTVAYTNFINSCNTKETTKLASAIIQNQSKGNAEIGLLLKAMASEAWQERRHKAKRYSEKANAKLMIPTMLLFLAILGMIMVPVAMNFMSL